MSTSSSVRTHVFTIDLDATTRDGESNTDSIESYRPSNSDRPCGYRYSQVDFRRLPFMVDEIP